MAAALLDCVYSQTPLLRGIGCLLRGLSQVPRLDESFVQGVLGYSMQCAISRLWLGQSYFPHYLADSILGSRGQMLQCCYPDSDATLIV